MSTFQAFLQLGWEHILDLKGYDHMLFLLALLAKTEYKEWKRVLILVTAFTIGHSITLVLTALNSLPLSGEWIEFLIPVTIAFTAIINIIFSKEGKMSTWARYFFALFFGLIHGMGFSNFFGSLQGRDADLLMPLFSFNLGIELGQLLFVLIVFTLQFVLFITNISNKKAWNLVLSGAALGIAITIMIENYPL